MARPASDSRALFRRSGWNRAGRLAAQGEEDAPASGIVRSCLFTTEAGSIRRARRLHSMEGFPEGFNLAALLAPIPGDAPAGVDLRGDASPQSLYCRLRDARADARASERAAESEDPLSTSPPEWRTIRDLGVEAIAGYSKDLEIAGWLTEALLRSDGLPGFAAGVQ